MKLSKYLARKYLVFYYGSLLIGLSIWFWFKYGLFGFIPPVTSIVIIAGVISIWILIRCDNIRQNVFGTIKKDARKFLLKALGTIFTGFVLMITIIWGLAAQNPHLHPFIVHIQSFLLVMLFFYFVGSFYCILADL